MFNYLYQCIKIMSFHNTLIIFSNVLEGKFNAGFRDSLFIQLSFILFLCRKLHILSETMQLHIYKSIMGYRIYHNLFWVVSNFENYSLLKFINVSSVIFQGFVIPVNIRVTDANDNTPQFINAPYILNISEVISSKFNNVLSIWLGYWQLVLT